MTSQGGTLSGRGVWRGLVFLFTLLPAGLGLPLRCAAQEAPAAHGPTIRVNVERVNVGVVVTDPKGRFVEGLGPENFQVLDNGTPQQISEFASVEAPGQVLLLVEAGPAVYLLQDAHLFVADSLLHGLSADDRVALVSYNDGPRPVLNFTTDKREAQAALDQIQFNLGYGNLNLAASLNTVLDWLVAIPGKKTLVLVSTGVDTSPESIMQTVRGRLATTDVQILAVSMSGPLRNGKEGRKRDIQQTQLTFERADAWLTAIAEATGGRAYFPENTKAFQETYKQIAEVVRHEYSLAFRPPAADGEVHSIDVKVDSGAKRPKEQPIDYRVNHRKAYRAPTAAR